MSSNLGPIAYAGRPHLTPEGEVWLVDIGCFFEQQGSACDWESWQQGLQILQVHAVKNSDFGTQMLLQRDRFESL